MRDCKSQSDVEAYKVSAENNYLRGGKGKFPRTFKQFKRKKNGESRNSVFQKMKANVEQKGGESKCSKRSNPAWRKWGVNLEGDFENRRSGGVKPKIKRPVSNAEAQIASRLIAQFGLIRRKVGRWGARLLISAGECRRARKEKERRPILLVWSRGKWAQKMKKFRRTK